MNILISFRNTSTAATDVSSGGRIVWIIISISSILGAAVIITLALVGHAILRRRRKAAFRAFEAARLRDPTLTWEVYVQRRRLTHSRLLFEEELQRSTIIRKSQQSRTSIINKRVEGISKSINNKGGEGKEDETFLKTRWGDDNWPLEASYAENNRDPMNDNRYPLALGNIQLAEEGDKRDYICPTNIQLKTPPLLAHPAFRDCNRPFPPRSSSLPMEMTRTKAFPLL
ncbi:hypothetical protein F4781DRAFT_408089 [Annulohypoxylon bovei var. microspora]|nr:hypothetical protein F4781DRAFT_408089 [Annulohypoxylon bovei var. microspora]